MSRPRALEVDEGQVVADYDDELRLWCVFGVHSGYCYSQHESELAAETAVTKSHVRRKTMPAPEDPCSYHVTRSPLPQHAEQPLAAPRRPSQAPSGSPRTGREDVIKDATQQALAELGVLERQYPRRAPRLFRHYRRTLGLIAAVDKTAETLRRS